MKTKTIIFIIKPGAGTSSSSTTDGGDTPTTKQVDAEGAKANTDDGNIVDTGDGTVAANTKEITTAINAVASILGYVLDLIFLLYHLCGSGCNRILSQ